MNAAELNAAADAARLHDDIGISTEFALLRAEGYRRHLEFQELTRCINHCLFGVEHGVANRTQLQEQWRRANEILEPYGAKLHDEWNRLGLK